MKDVLIFPSFGFMTSKGGLAASRALKLDVKKQQYQNQYYLYNVRESTSPKDVLLHQERMCLFVVMVFKY